MTFDKRMFDVVSFYMIEGDDEHVSVHAYKRPNTCVKFFIPVEMMTSPDLWTDLDWMAGEKWREEERFPACPACGTTRRNWARYYYGRVFCGVCGDHSKG